MNNLFGLLFFQASATSFNPPLLIIVLFIVVLIISFIAYKKAPTNTNHEISGTTKNETESYFTEKDKIDSTTLSFPSKLVDSSIADIIKIFGWIYFTISLIGSIILWANASDYPDAIAAIMVAFGIAGILSSLIVISICLGIARIIEQNIYLINSRKQ